MLHNFFDTNIIVIASNYNLWYSLSVKEMSSGIITINEDNRDWEWYHCTQKIVVCCDLRFLHSYVQPYFKDTSTSYCFILYFHYLRAFQTGGVTKRVLKFAIKLPKRRTAFKPCHIKVEKGPARWNHGISCSRTLRWHTPLNTTWNHDVFI